MWFLRSAAIVALGTVVLGACAAPSAPATSPADAAHCPGRTLRVAVSVSQWTDVVRTLGGSCTTVTTVLDSAVLDPHDHELTTGNIAAFAGADLVVLNGAHYDTWAQNAAAHLQPRPRVVDVAEVAGAAADHADHADPHLWYDPEAVQRASSAITAELSRLSPDASGYFEVRALEWRRDLAPYLAELARLRQELTGRTYAATETVFDHTAAALGLRDVTPAGYRSAISNEGEPGPGDVVAFEQAMHPGGIDVLIFNPQTEGSLPDLLRSAAEAAGVPVVDVTESPPDPRGSFVAWQLDQLHRLAEAYAVTS